jgi:histidyl-tRNA synthetase
LAQFIERPRGTADVPPDEIYKWQYVESVAKGVARDFGFREIRFPVFEHTELFLRGVGDTTDVVQKEMYTFTDKGGRSITLRPEGTASAVRSALENSLFAAGLPLKAYYIVPNFRYEKPQKGRLREHHQFGVELFGASDALADAEIIQLAAEYLRRLEITRVTLEINSIGCPECRTRYHAALKEYFTAHIDTLCDTCKERLERNPLRILDCKSEVCHGVAMGAPIGLDYLCGDCKEHFETLQSYLSASGIEFTVNPRIVRGLDYYTRTVFEFVSDAIGAQGTVLGGGRYDGLVHTLGGASTPGLGFGSGIERILLTMEAEGFDFAKIKPRGIDLFIAAADDSARAFAQKLTNELRRLGISAENDLMGRSLKAQMKYANKIGARCTVTIGGNEIETGVATVKNMFKSGAADDTHDNSAVKISAEAIAWSVRKIIEFQGAGDM